MTDTAPWYAQHPTLETIATARAVRAFTDEPVPREVLRTLVQAGTCAPNGRNLQPWEFVVVTDPVRRAALGAALEPRAQEVDAVVPRLRDPAKQRMYRGAAALMRALGQAPALVFVAGHEYEYGPEFPDREILLSALHSAAQNILLAARALGYGGAYTTLHLHAEAAVRETIGLPPELYIAATLPIGRPDQATGPVRRRPVDEVMHWDHYEPGEGS